MRVVNGAHIPGRFLAGTLHALGFRKSGKPVEEFEPNGNTVIIQPVTCALKESAGGWTAQRALCIAHLAVRGFTLVGEKARSAEMNLYARGISLDESVQHALAPDCFVGANGELRS
jgi:hypothetical protein